MVCDIKIITILTFLLLLNCGYEPIYSKKKLETNYNFTIKTIVFSGENIINQNLKNNLKNYINKETKPIKYDLNINSNSNRSVTSKDKKGNPELFSLKVTINLEVFENDKLKNSKVFNETFEYKNRSSKFSLKQYEENIKKNLSSKLSEDILQYLYYTK